MALDAYVQQVQRFLRDQSQKYVNPQDIISYVNRARREIALRTQSVRILTPVSGGITTATITAAGSGYTAPTVTISAPDFPNGQQPFPNGDQATADAIVVGGQISQINISNGGSGYFQPQITITDPTGTGATATVAITPIMQTQQGQEVYNFDQIPLSNFPGVGEVFWVNSVSVIFSAYRYSFMCYSFSTYQAMIRNYPLAYQYVPSVFAQLGRGTKGSLYCYPVASQPYQLELDCYCLPSDLTDDQSEEAIPSPWTDIVPYFATHLAYLELQNLNAAQYYLGLHDQMMGKYSGWTAQRRVSNRYGRW